MSLPDSAEGTEWALPQIEAVLPHRGAMLLLDRLLAASASMLAAEYQVPEQAWYSNANAAMPAWIGLEAMAQAVAAHVAVKALRDGGTARLGVLLGTRSYLAQRAEFDAVTVLRIEAREVFYTEAGHSAYECMIVQQDQILAQAVIKVFQPADFDEFIKGSVI